MREQTDILAPMDAQMILKILTDFGLVWVRAGLVSCRKIKMSVGTRDRKKAGMQHLTLNQIVMSFRLFFLGALCFTALTRLNAKAVS